MKEGGDFGFEGRDCRGGDGAFADGVLVFFGGESWLREKIG